MPQNFLKYFFIFIIFSTNALAASNENQIDQVIQKFVHAYEKCDLRTLSELYAPNAMVIGTGDDEVIQGKKEIIAAFKRDFKQSLDSKISTKRIAMKVDGDTAFASYYLLVNVKLPNSAPFQSKLRFTVGLEKENNHWVIAQSHLSAPLASQHAGESFPHA